MSKEPKGKTILPFPHPDSVKAFQEGLKEMYGVAEPQFPMDTRWPTFKRAIIVGLQGAMPAATAVDCPAIHYLTEVYIRDRFFEVRWMGPVNFSKVSNEVFTAVDEQFKVFVKEEIENIKQYIKE